MTVWGLAVGVVCFLWGGCAASATFQHRSIEYSDLEPGARQILANQGKDAPLFPDFIRALDRETEERLRAGESDDLIYFLLQAKTFTRRPKIEPALSAREFVHGLTTNESEAYLSGGTVASLTPRVPANVKDRMQDFLRALGRPQPDERLRWFQKSVPAAQRRLDHLCAEYARTMRFVYQKEIAKGAAGASLYQDRGYSSDTRIESSFAVSMGLSVLKELNAGFHVRRALIVGPGLDFAPRTDLIDSYPPQSYQPFALADALLASGLAKSAELRIDCVDINDRVLDFIREFPKRKERRLILLRGWDSPEYDEYFRKEGRQIGTESAIAGGKSLLVSKHIADSITADKLNVITERYDPSPQYDLIVATNVLVYFNDVELLLALSNIRSMLGERGYLIHNELRPKVEEFSTLLEFGPLQARTLRLAGEGSHALFDSFVIHRKLGEHERH
jgi:CheR methyltransferase-like protein